MQKIWNNSDRLAIVILIVMMAMKVSLSKLLAGVIPAFNLPYDPPVICAVYVAMIAVVYILVLMPRISRRGIKGIITEYKYIVIMMMVLMCSIVLTDVVTIAKNQLRITNILTHNLDYMYTFLALPLGILLIEKRWRWESFVDTILGLSLASMVMRYAVSVYFGRTLIEIECIAMESAWKYWIRNERLRVVPPCFIMLIVPISLYMFIYTKGWIRRCWYFVNLIFASFYIYYVWQSRAGLICIFVSIAVICLFMIASKKQIYIKWGIAATGAAVFVLLGGVNRLIMEFSRDDTAQYVGENRGHFNAYNLFWPRFLKTPLLGEGLTETLAEWYPNGRALWLCDAGIMYSLLPMGVLILVVYFLMFGRGIYTYVKGYKSNVMAVLALSVTLALIGCEVSMDCFFTPTAYAVPFYIVIVEYIHRQGLSK